MKVRRVRLDAGTVMVVVLFLVVIAALLSGFDVINGGYSQADIPIGF
jgi:hypothetical protein